MKNLVVNIGLNVGKSEPYNQAFETLLGLQRNFEFGVDDFDTEKGTWEHEEEDGVRTTIEERVLKVRIKVGRMTKHAINGILSNMALDLDQDAIAYILNGVGSIAYSPMYTGERYEFNKDYFKTF